MRSKTSNHLLASALFTLAWALPTGAETLISNFDDFQLDGLFAWSDAVVESGPVSYSITDRGYGSGFKNINPNMDATGETTLIIGHLARWRRLTVAGLGPSI